MYKIDIHKVKDTEKNIKELSLDECKIIQIKILDELHDYCTKNNLIYILGFGTLLGAIRHNGFIPWDDDIDIIMPRRDYDILCKSFKSDGYKLLCYDKDSAYPYQFAKIIDENTLLVEESTVYYEIGVYIDIFPFDYVPADKVIRKKYYKKINRMNRTHLCKSVTRAYRTDFKHKIYHNLVKLLSFWYSIPQLVGKIEQTIRETQYVPLSENVACYTFRNGWKWELPYDIYFLRCLHVFEGKMYYIPKNYDILLRKMYGDYMTPPPIEKRTSNHVNKAYHKLYT